MLPELTALANTHSFTHIEARYQYGAITCLPLLMLTRQGKITGGTTVKNFVSRLRCARCGTTAPPAK